MNAHPRVEPAAVERARREVAQGARVLSRLGHLDVLGHLSARAGSRAFAVTPAFGSGAAPLPQLTAEDVVVVDDQGQRLAGQYEPTRELPLHLALYAARPETGAVVVAAPRTTVALAIAGWELQPVSHAEAWLALEGSASLRADGFVAGEDEARRVVGALGDRSVCHLRGVATIFVADGVGAALSRCHAYEYLARMNVLTAALTPQPRRVTREESAAIETDRAIDETVRTVDPHDYLTSMDDPAAGAGPTLAERFGPPADEDEAGRIDVALACRVLAAQGTLVGFYEHVSCRLPDGHRFAMCPAKNFSQMEPGDVAVLGLDPDAEWLEGPRAPAPFRRFHRDIFVARPDVQAIVHTHEMYGRAFAMAGRPLEPVFRNGFHLARAVPTLARPCMVFSPADRAAALGALGDDDLVHVLGHGTDYVAGSIEKATVDAVHREDAFRTYHLALRMGQPEPLSDAMVEDLRRSGPQPADWWAHYCALL